MITSKNRAYLRGMANSLDPVLQIGKAGITEELIAALAAVLEKQELIKVHVLETALLDTKAACGEVAAALKAEPVQAIGSKFVIYKQARKQENRKITFPKK